VANRLPSRILVVRLGAIGDVTNALVFASALREHDPEVEIGWVVHPLAEPLVRDHPAVSRVHLWRKQDGWKGLRAVLREIRACDYELAVDLQRITKSALLARWSGAPRVLGYDRLRAKEHSWIWTRERIPHTDPGAHMVEQYLEVARHLGAPAERPIHQLPTDPVAEGWAAELVRELGAAPIIINVGASKPANRWLPERFGQLAALCRRELDLPVCLTGAPHEQSIAREALEAAGPDSGIHDVVGQTSLRQLVALLDRARLFIGCDTGPMHLAAATGTQVVALFGPADPRRTGPFGESHRVVRVSPECAPCNRRECNQPRHACMDDITPELVLQAARETLGQVSAV